VDAGIKAEHLDGKMGDKQRKAILTRLKTGETQIICNADVLCAGWDEPSIECVILARPTQSETLYIQQGGRGLRTCEEIGKTECIILDHAGNTMKHGLLTVEREHSLYGIGEAEKVEKKKAKDSDRYCPSCWKLVGMDSKICFACGFSLVVMREIEELSGDLIQINGDFPLDLRIKFEYSRLCTEARRKGYKKQWAFYRLLDKYTAEQLEEVLGSNQVPYGIKNQEQIPTPAWMRI
jgi:DNA repair protein RadD